MKVHCLDHPIIYTHQFCAHRQQFFQWKVLILEPLCPYLILSSLYQNELVLQKAQRFHTLCVFFQVSFQVLDQQALQVRGWRRALSADHSTTHSRTGRLEQCRISIR